MDDGIGCHVQINVHDYIDSPRQRRRRGREQGRWWGLGFAGMSSSPVLTIPSLMPSRINLAGMELQSSFLGPSPHDQHLGLGLGLGGEGHMGIYASPLNSYNPGRSQLNHYFEHTQNPNPNPNSIHQEDNNDDEQPGQ